MRILNLYAGIGGNRALWGEDHEVTAVELDPGIAAEYAIKFPNDEIIVGDAHQFLIDNFQWFDFIWSSPPCPSHSRMNKNFKHIRYADLNLYQEIILLETWFDGLYAVENVLPYYEPLRPFKQYGRHAFWANFPITEKRGNQPKQINVINRKHRKQGLTIAKIKSGTHRKQEQNSCLPETGLYILNSAMNKITKLNVKQTDLFE